MYKVRRLQDGKEYALKKVDFLKAATKEKDNALNEVNILTNLRSENIIRFHEAFLTDDG